VLPATLVIIWEKVWRTWASAFLIGTSKDSQSLLRSGFPRLVLSYPPVRKQCNWSFDALEAVDKL